MVFRSAAIAGLFALGISLCADDPKPGKLKPLPDTAVDLADAEDPCSVEVSPDGRFVYAASFHPGCVSVFERDAKTGALKPVERIAGEAHLEGAVRTELSPGGRLLAIAAFRANAVSIYSRDESTGKLAFLSQIGTGDTAGTFHWAINPTWSPDGKFLYVSDSRSEGEQGEGDGRIVVLKVEDGKTLSLVERYHPGDNSASNLRGFTVHPDGRTAFAAASTSGTLAVLNRDPETGKLSLRQILRGGGGLAGLGGVVGVICSPDGRFVYTTSGRFKNESSEDAVNAFFLASDGQLHKLQHFDGSKNLNGFAGGNKLALSADGKSLFASGTNSNHLAHFDRDPATGKLALREVVEGWKDPELKGINGLAASPDGRHLYATWEFSKGISAFERAGR